MNKPNILEVADKLESLINQMTPESQGRWDYGVFEKQSDEKHLADYATALSKTREYFKIEGDMEIYGAFVENSDVKIALSGCSPTACIRAEYIALLSPENVRILIDYVRTKESA